MSSSWAGTTTIVVAMMTFRSVRTFGFRTMNAHIFLAPRRVTHGSLRHMDIHSAHPSMPGRSIGQLFGNDDIKKRKIAEMMDDVVLPLPASLRGRQEENQPTMVQAANHPATRKPLEIAHHDAAAVQRVDFDNDATDIQDLLRKGTSLVIEEGRVTWYFDSYGCAVVKELLEAPEVRVVDTANDIDEMNDIYYYELTSGFDPDMSIDPILISRHHSRGVVQAIQNYQSNKPCSVSQLVGPPGVGKSRTLMLLLREHLLSKSNASARFYMQKDGKAHWIIRIDSKLWCFRAYVAAPFGSFMTDPLKGTMFDKSLVLLDPREASQGGADYARPRALDKG